MQLANKNMINLGYDTSWLQEIIVRDVYRRKKIFNSTKMLINVVIQKIDKLRKTIFNVSTKR